MYLKLCITYVDRNRTKLYITSHNICDNEYIVFLDVANCTKYQRLETALKAKNIEIFSTKDNRVLNDKNLYNYIARLKKLENKARNYRKKPEKLSELHEETLQNTRRFVYLCRNRTREYVIHHCFWLQNCRNNRRIPVQVLPYTQRSRARGDS